MDTEQPDPQPQTLIPVTLKRKAGQRFSKEKGAEIKATIQAWYRAEPRLRNPATLRELARALDISLSYARKVIQPIAAQTAPIDEQKLRETAAYCSATEHEHFPAIIKALRQKALKGDCTAAKTWTQLVMGGFAGKQDGAQNSKPKPTAAEAAGIRLPIARESTFSGKQNETNNIQSSEQQPADPQAQNSSDSGADSA